MIFKASKVHYFTKHEENFYIIDESLLIKSIKIDYEK